MTPDAIEGREDPFGNHIVPQGSQKTVGYLLRLPSHGGHWITLLPSGVVSAASPAHALLCDSLYPAPFLLTREETEQLLQAFVIDAPTSQDDYNTDFACFLVGSIG